MKIMVSLKKFDKKFYLKIEKVKDDKIEKKKLEPKKENIKFINKII